MPFRPVACALSGSIAVLMLGALAVSFAGGAAPARRSTPTDAALNHWVFDAGTATRAELLQHAEQVVQHMKKAHPEARFVLARERPEVQAENQLHFLLETVDMRTQRQFLDIYGQDDVCRALLQREDTTFKMKEDVYMRLIASDPEKEQGMAPWQRTVVWKLTADFPRLGQAIECAERLVRHLNATYTQFAFRAYDEWFPQSGGIRIYVLDSEDNAVQWEAAEARIRRDPAVRELFEGASDAFVEGSFTDSWLMVLAR